MAVDANHQGKGLGKLIVQYLEARAKEEAMGEIILQARENAVEFYKSLGYELVEPTFKLFGEIQHYLMRKQLH
jgi:GNAT superfamily N-acetyltransferase